MSLTSWPNKKPSHRNQFVTAKLVFVLPTNLPKGPNESGLSLMSRHFSSQKQSPGWMKTWQMLLFYVVSCSSAPRISYSSSFSFLYVHTYSRSSSWIIDFPCSHFFVWATRWHFQYSTTRLFISKWQNRNCARAGSSCGVEFIIW